MTNDGCGLRAVKRAGVQVRRLMMPTRSSEALSAVVVGERAGVVARFGAGVPVGAVMAEFGVAHTSACWIRDEAAWMGRRVVDSRIGSGLPSGSGSVAGSGRVSG